MKKIIILGCGRVGRAIALDLKGKYNITSVDIDKKALDYLKSTKLNIKTINADISNKKILKTLIKDFDLVICAVPGFMGYKTLKTIIEEGKNIVDISFFPEDPFSLDKIAKKNDTPVVIDAGVAPGMSNIILGHHNKTMDINSFECYVGGLPVKRTLPFQYKAPFSPKDVIEEYLRPARMVENGKIVTKEPLSEPELIEFPIIGTLEAFNTDGLRTLLKLKNIPFMKEKTLRYPGHIEYIKFLKSSGFFSTKKIKVKENYVNPLDFTSTLLFKEWLLEKGEKEFTCMRINIIGVEKGKKRKYVYNLFDKYNAKTGISSMARTTGYTCTAIASLVLENKIKQKGIIPPEIIGADNSCFSYIMNYLRKRNVNYQRDIY